MAVIEKSAASFTIYNDLVHLRTDRRLQFIDITELVAQRVRRSGVLQGQVTVQALHTTAAVVVNENEPLLLEDFKSFLERLAPLNGRYRHDDPDQRTANLVPGERANGHAHARALLLGSSTTLHVLDGRLELGRWQSLFLVELDGGRKRGISITAIGAGGDAGA